MTYTEQELKEMILEELKESDDDFILAETNAYARLAGAAPRMSIGKAFDLVMSTAREYIDSKYKK